MVAGGVDDNKNNDYYNVAVNIKQHSYDRKNEWETK